MSTSAVNERRQLDALFQKPSTSPAQAVASSALSSDENTAPNPINNASIAPPQNSTTKKIPIEIGGKQYLMTVYIGDKALELTDQDNIEKVKNLALKLFEGVDTSGKTIKTISDKGIVDITGQTLHTFDNSQAWETFKTEIRRLNTVVPNQLPSTSMKIDFTPDDVLDDDEESENAPLPPAPLSQQEAQQTLNNESQQEAQQTSVEAQQELYNRAQEDGQQEAQQTLNDESQQEAQQTSVEAQQELYNRAQEDRLFAEFSERQSEGQ